MAVKRLYQPQGNIPQDQRTNTMAAESSYPIVIEGLTKTFNGFTAVNSLSLKVKRNSFVGFLGPNGAGKTTTIKILTNLLDATAGSAFLNGIDITKDPKEALSCVGAVVETPEFYPYLTPNESMEYLGRLRGMSIPEIRTRTNELMELVKMEEWADKRIGSFSKGMKQRCAIAQALLHEPSIIVLDEPTSGLDPRGRVEVKREDYTIFMSSHLLNEVQETCDEVALINQGTLLAHDTVEALTAKADVRKIEVRTLRPIEEASIKTISHLQGVEVVAPVNRNTMLIDLKGGDEQQARLLHNLDELGLDPLSFNQTGNQLEDLYLSMIKESR
jgi:ABC-2 type transport system ATP-binding protein